MRHRDSVFWKMFELRQGTHVAHMAEEAVALPLVFSKSVIPKNLWYIVLGQIIKWPQFGKLYFWISDTSSEGKGGALYRPIINPWCHPMQALVRALQQFANNFQRVGRACHESAVLSNSVPHFECISFHHHCRLRHYSRYLLITNDAPAKSNLT